MASSGLVILLLAQYVLGIAYNLYGTAPTATKTVKMFSSGYSMAMAVLTAVALLCYIAMVKTPGARSRDETRPQRQN